MSGKSLQVDCITWPVDHFNKMTITVHFVEFAVFITAITFVFSVQAAQMRSSLLIKIDLNCWKVYANTKMLK